MYAFFNSFRGGRAVPGLSLYVPFLSLPVVTVHSPKTETETQLGIILVPGISIKIQRQGKMFDEKDGIKIAIYIIFMCFKLLIQITQGRWFFPRSVFCVFIVVVVFTRCIVSIFFPSRRQR